MLQPKEILDRFELMNPNVTVLQDVRRSILDKDESSIFRVLGELSQQKILVEELRKTTMEVNGHSLFRLLESGLGIATEDIRRAFLEKNLHSVFRILEKIDPNNDKIDLYRKALLNETHMYEILKLFIDSHLLTTIRKIEERYTDIDIHDCFSRGQLQSKMWLINELKKTSLGLGTVFICAGWYGSLASLLFEKGFTLDKIRSFDIDPSCAKIAEELNRPYVMENWKFKASTKDILDLKLSGDHYTTVKSNGDEEELFDEPDTIINTSCEHIENWTSWWNLIPEGKKVVLQVNNYSELPEHVNCVQNVEEFKEIAPLSTVLFEGGINLGKYTRFMLIGIK